VPQDIKEVPLSFEKHSQKPTFPCLCDIIVAVKSDVLQHAGTPGVHNISKILEATSKL
jgi:hypothetical protein